MAAGDIDVQMTTTLTAAGIKTACDAAITATSAAATITATMINDKTIVIIAREA
jgi:hypothetical protein